MSNIQTIAAQIATIADKEAYTINYVANSSELLAAYGVDTVTVSQNLSQVVAAASLLFREAINHTLAVVRKHNAKVHSEPTYNIPVTQIEIGGKTAATPKLPRATVKPVRAQIFGYSVTAVLRWMGANGWEFGAAVTACENMAQCYKLSDVTVRLQLKAGKDGTRGPAAPVTPSQAKSLRNASK